MGRRERKPVHMNIFKYSSVTPKSDQNWLRIKFISSLDATSLKFLKYFFGQKSYLEELLLSFSDCDYIFFNMWL